MSACSARWVRAWKRSTPRLHALSALRDKPSGTIRITAGEHAADAVLGPSLARMLPAYPDIHVEIVVDYSLTDIVAGSL